MKPECPYYSQQGGLYVAEVDDWVDGSVICNLVDKSCLVEYGKPEDCDIYQEFLREDEL